MKKNSAANTNKETFAVFHTWGKKKEILFFFLKLSKHFHSGSHIKKYISCETVLFKFFSHFSWFFFLHFSHEIYFKVLIFFIFLMNFFHILHDFFGLNSD